MGIETKISLADMAEVAEEEARHASDRADFYSEREPNAPMFAVHRRRALALERTAHTLRILATFEDKSRKFVAGLLEEHRRG